MSEEKKTVELKDEELEKANGGGPGPDPRGALLVCQKCGRDQYEYEVGVGNTCRFCGWGTLFRK